MKDTRDKNEKQLKVIKDQGEKQLDAIKNINTDSKLLKKIIYFYQLSSEATELSEKFKKEKNDIDPEKLVCAKTDNKTVFNFNVFKTPVDLASDVHRKKTSLKVAESKQ